jgi:hypothetical protein
MAWPENEIIVKSEPNLYFKQFKALIANNREEEFLH